MHAPSSAIQTARLLGELSSTIKFQLISSPPVVLAPAAQLLCQGPTAPASRHHDFSPPHSRVMDTLDSPFTIEINGAPISKITDDAELPVQAKVGADAAAFTLESGRLKSCGQILGRSMTEDRSMLPKRVLWFSSNTSEDKIQSVTAQPDGSSYKLLFAGAPLTENNGAVFADLLQDGASTVQVKMQ